MRIGEGLFDEGAVESVAAVRNGGSWLISVMMRGGDGRIERVVGVSKLRANGNYRRVEDYTSVMEEVVRVEGEINGQ